MSPTRFSLKHPYAVIAFALLVAAMGIMGYVSTPVDLFPETAPPQVVVLTTQPGASASDVEDNITEVVEKELNTISELETLRSTSRDQVSSVMVEFAYTKDPGVALLDVQNALARVRADLPQGAQEPQIYELSDASAQPLLTLALSPAKGGRKSLSDIRLLAENQIKDRILRLDGIADVDVFGGHQPEVRVRVDRDRLAAHESSLDELIGVLAAQNISAPAGTIYTEESEYLVTTTGEFEDLNAIRNLPVRRTDRGILRVSDLATVELAEEDQRAIYPGNGKESIALGVIRPDEGRTVDAINRVKDFLPRLKAEYPDTQFEITQDQAPLIELNLQGMRNSIIQAVVLTVVIIFLFLADMRAALVVSISIPLAFLFTLVVLWFTPFTLNMVTLTGLIVAIGIVVDSSVVTVENIYRRYRGMDEPDPEKAALAGTRQIALAITAGILTTVAVLVPIMFIGGYPQRTIGRLSFTVATTLVASLVVALTVIPLVTSWLLGIERDKPNIIERAASWVDRGVDVLRDFYVYVLKRALRWRVVTLIITAGFFILTVRLIPPLIGNTLMPPMDTGIVTVQFNTPATDSPGRVEGVLDDVEDVIYDYKGIEKVSSVVGSEPGALSFGTGGSTAQSATLTVHLVPRTQREESIWDIQQMWRRKLREIPGIQDYRISEFGATPMASTKAPIDILISGPNPEVLGRLANRTLEKLEGVKGLTDVRRSWYFDEKERNVQADPALVRKYATSPEKMSRQLRAAVNGIPATSMRLEHYLDIPIRVEYSRKDLRNLTDLEDVYVGSRYGPLPLRTLADVNTSRERPFITRENLMTTIDVTAVNTGKTVGQVSGDVRSRVSEIEPPRGYDIEFSGTIKDMRRNQGRLRGALVVGVILLYLLLLIMFNSFAYPVSIMSIIPVAIAGSFWGLLAFDKPMCMPGMMGMIFLAGTKVNDSIMLLDFIVEFREDGMSRREAILESIRLRLRPILMTTFSTVVGLSPLVFEMAVGLERMSPLAIVAATGMLVGTFLTIIVVPVVYSSIDSLIGYAGKAGKFMLGRNGR
ncbi:MAG: efflux RND transporter permease subunit [Planctomycetota bacterium]